VIDALRAAHPGGAGAVLDLVSGPDAIRRDAGVIRPGGRLVPAIFTAGEGGFAQRQITARNHSSRTNPLISPEGLTTVAPMLADRTITARIGSTADPDAAGQGLDQLRRGALRSKAVIRLQSPGAPAPHDPSGPAHRMDRRTRPAARWDSTGPGPARTGPRAGSAAIPRHPIAGHERVRTQSMTQQPAWTQMPLPNIHACHDGRPTMMTAFISSSSGLHAASWTCRTLRRQRHAALARGAGAFTGGRRSSVGRVGFFSAPSASLLPAAAAAAFFDRGNAGSSSAMARGCAWSCSIC
jgi:hypothetical protein